MSKKLIVNLYKESWNLGDAIQTLALARLVNVHAGIFRGEKIYLSDEYLHIVNGFISSKYFIPHHDSLFAGVHVDPDHEDIEVFKWLEGSSYPIGVRDPWTFEYLEKRGIESVLIGCATITFPEIEVKGKELLNVESDNELGGAKKLSHWIPKDMSWEKQWNRAQSYVTRYSLSGFVSTSRLHVALVCMAYGVPFYMDTPKNDGMARRFTLLSEMGVKFGEVNEISRDVVGLWRKRYLDFLGGYVEVGDHSPGFVRPLWDVDL